tara:strand:+ start:1515 stop:2072 length:558 start_codon:yes stop_codon:yes gene_type:complete
MKIFNLIKQTPFLLILTTIIFLNICNQKQNTRLKILIWNTPYLSLGNYLAISASTGFVLSYLVTTNLYKENKSNFKKQLEYKLKEDNGDNNLNQFEDLNKEINNQFSYDNNFIERDIKDPSPTINASFRIISNNDIRRKSPIKNQSDSDSYSDESDNKYYEDEINYDGNKSPILNDWEDNSFTNW